MASILSITGGSKNSRKNIQKNSQNVLKTNLKRSLRRRFRRSFLRTCTQLSGYYTSPKVAESKTKAKTKAKTRAKIPPVSALLWNLKIPPVRTFRLTPGKLSTTSMGKNQLPGPVSHAVYGEVSNRTFCHTKNRAGNSRNSVWLCIAFLVAVARDRERQRRLLPGWNFPRFADQFFRPGRAFLLGTIVVLGQGYVQILETLIDLEVIHAADVVVGQFRRDVVTAD